MSTHIPAEVFPPGDFIQEEIDARGWTQGDLAAIIRRPIQAVNEIIASKRAITADTAQALGEAFGTGAQLWMNLEAEWRLSQAESPDGGIARRAKLYSAGPVKELVRRQWIEPTDNEGELESRVLKFMGIPSVNEKARFAAAARMSASYCVEKTPSQVAWLRQAQRMAYCVDVSPFKKARFGDAVKDIRDLAAHEADVRRVPRFLAELGVRLVVVEHLQGTKMDGAAFWLDSKSPVIALSMRYDRIDYFWHTLGHEIGHIENGDGQCFMDDDTVSEESQEKPAKPEQEILADRFAAELVVASEELEHFIARVKPLYSRKKIVGFANRIGVHPGIVVGQLQFRDEIGYWHSRPLLTKVRQQLTEAALSDGWGQAVQIPEGE